MNKEFQCSGYCPIQTLKGCCSPCARKFGSYITEDNKHLWSDKDGFWVHGGCALGEQRPRECKVYNCHDHEWAVIKKWIDNDWKNVDLKEIPRGCTVAGTVRIGADGNNS